MQRQAAAEIKQGHYNHLGRGLLEGRLVQLAARPCKPSDANKTENKET
jgi:hypothetical protein